MGYQRQLNMSCHASAVLLVGASINPNNFKGNKHFFRLHELDM